MSHFLDANQVAEACCALDLQEHTLLIEAAVQAAGEAIAKKLGIVVANEANTQPGFGGLCIGFGPATEGQQCPAEIADFDTGSEWMEGALDNA